MEEIWKEIPGTNGSYEASTLGQIRRANHRGLGYPKILRQNKQGNGYLIVSLSINAVAKTKLVHRLIAQTFIPNPNNLPEVNHKYGNKEDNRVSELEWSTSSYNSVHAFSTGLNSAESRRKAVLQFSKSGEFIKRHASVTEAAACGFELTNVAACCRGKHKSHRGYIWKYESEPEKLSIAI